MQAERARVLERRSYRLTHLQPSHSGPLVFESRLDLTSYEEAMLRIVVEGESHSTTQMLNVTATALRVVAAGADVEILGTAAPATATVAPGTTSYVALSPQQGSHVQLAIDATESASSTGLSYTITLMGATTE